MKDTNEISELIADVREQVIYFKELGVELLDVTMAEAGAGSATADKSTTTGAARADATPNAVAIPRDLPDVPMAAPIEMLKPNVKRPSKLAGLPSLSKRAPLGNVTGNGNSVKRANETHDANSAEILGEGTKEMTATGAPSLADALFDVGPELPKTSETIEDIRRDIGDCTRC